MHVATLKDDPPGREEGFKEWHAGELPALPHVGVKAGQHGLDGQVSEAVGGGGEDISNAGVHVGVVAGVAAQVASHGFIAHNVTQVVPENKHLRGRGGSRGGGGHQTGFGAPSGGHQVNFVLFDYFKATCV